MVCLPRLARAVPMRGYCTAVGGAGGYWVWRLAALVLLLLLPVSAWAQEQFEQHTDAVQKEKINRRWSVGLTAGVYNPSFQTLNNALNTPGLVIVQDPNFLIPQNQDLPIEIRDVAAADLTSTINYGMEGQWDWTDRVSFVVMALNWQGRSQVSDEITMSLRSNLPPVTVPRTARYNMNINQLWLGWRLSIFNRPNQGRLYVNLGVAGISVADFTADALIKVQLPADQNIPSFASISSTEFHGTAYSTRYGVGGEVVLSKNISVGFHINYIFGEMQKFRVKRYFPSGFTELPPIPPTSTNNLPPNVIPSTFAPPEVGDQLSTAQVEVARETTELLGETTDLVLDLDGWDAAFTFRVYY